MSVESEQMSLIGGRGSLRPLLFFRVQLLLKSADYILGWSVMNRYYFPSHAKWQIENVM